jgi:hypothetical protein
MVFTQTLDGIAMGTRIKLKKLQPSILNGKAPEHGLGNQLTRLMSGSLVLTTLGRSTNINSGRTIIITCRRKKIRDSSPTFQFVK